MNIDAIANIKGNYVYSNYWRTWSRVLQAPSRQNGNCWVELDITPVNPGRASAWERIRQETIRRHVTSRSEKDILLIDKPLPRTVVDELFCRLGEDRLHRLLTFDYLPRINWNNYRQHDNGGAPFNLLMKVL